MKRINNKIKRKLRNRKKLKEVNANRYKNIYNVGYL